MATRAALRGILVFPSSVLLLLGGKRMQTRVQSRARPTLYTAAGPFEESSDRLFAAAGGEDRKKRRQTRLASQPGSSCSREKRSERRVPVAYADATS